MFMDDLPFIVKAVQNRRCPNMYLPAGLIGRYLKLEHVIECDEVVNTMPLPRLLEAFTLEVGRDGQGLTGFLSEVLQAGLRVLSCDRLEMPLQDVFDRIVEETEQASGTDSEEAVS